MGRAADVKAPAASRCPRCNYLPASAIVICPRCQHDRRGHPPYPSKEKDLSMPSKMTAAFLTVFLVILFVADGAAAQPLARADVPDKLRPAAAESLAMIVPAKGVQIYECRASKERNGEYEWAFIAPEADLFDSTGAKKIGRHYAGPHWESSDGSRIVGAVVERADAPAANAIPWLLLGAKSVGPEGSFSHVTSVQRLHTAGGAAPRGGCFEAEAGTQIRIGYTADYYFFSPRHRTASRDFDIGD